MSNTTMLKFSSVGDKEDEELVNKCIASDFRPSFFRCEGTLLPEVYKEFANEILNFNVRDDDIWVCSFPKTGTTWTQEMVWCIANNVDLEGAKVTLDERFPFLEVCTWIDHKKVAEKLPHLETPKSMQESISYTDDLPSPRFIKSHLPFHLLPLQLQDGLTKAKVVYVCRNAKDTCVSYYYHSRLLDGSTATLEEFATLFLKDTVIFAPFWRHVLGFWNKRQNPNVLFLKYEDMKQDLPSVVRKTANFLGKTLTTEQLDILCHHLSFEEMRTNKAVNYEGLVELCKQLFKSAGVGSFMRSGTVGDWRTKLSPEMVRRFDQWTEDNLRGSDLTL